MPAKKPRYRYWDSSVLIDYVLDTPGRADTLRALWDDIAENKENRIVTSAVSILELGFVQAGRPKGTGMTEAEEKIDAMWQDPSILIAGGTEYIMREGRRLVRVAFELGLALKALDAIHLATATFIDHLINPIEEFNTYDGTLKRFEPLVNFPIKEPSDMKPRQLQFRTNDDNQTA